MALLCLSSPSLAAGPFPVELAWTAPPECEDQGEVERAVTEMLGESKLPDRREPIEAMVELRREPGGTFLIRLSTTTGERRGERELRADDCDDAKRAVALLLALMLDPNAVPPPDDAAPAPVAPAAEAPPAPAPPARPPASPPPARRSGVLVALGGAADVGTLPHFGYGAELTLGLVRPGWALEIRGGAWLPRSAGSRDLAGAGGNFTLFEAALAGCLDLVTTGRWSLDGCAGPALSRMDGEAFGVSDNGRATAIWASGLVEAGIAARASRRFSARLALGGRVPFSRPMFAIDRVGPVHRPRELAGRAELGLAMLF